MLPGVSVTDRSRERRKRKKPTVTSVIAAPPRCPCALQPESRICLSTVLWSLRRNRRRRVRFGLGDRRRREGCWLYRRARRRRRDRCWRIRRETLGRTLNDDLDEGSLEDSNRVRRTRSPGGEDRDPDANAREQHHPAEGQQDLRQPTRTRPGSDPQGFFVVTPFGRSTHDGSRSI